MAELTAYPVDVEPFLRGGTAAQAAVAAEVDRACRDTGFLVVTGHGVPLDVCNRVLDAFAAFFDRPLAEKERVIVADEGANRGYSALGKEGLAYSRGDTTPPDLFEAFNVGREDTDDPYYDEWRSFFAPNVWPTGPAELHATWIEYEQTVASLADVLLRALAQALQLDDDWFVRRCDHAIITTRAINYVRAPGAPEPETGQMRMGAHTDYGVLTILLADNVPGLQVFRDGTWHDVEIPRGSFVCNIGDMLERWTNDRWTSTLHRVVPPPADTTGAVRRRAIARFLDCPPDLVVETIPTCVTADRPARYEPVDAGAWLREKILGGRARQVPDLDGAHR